MDHHDDLPTPTHRRRRALRATVAAVLAATLAACSVPATDAASGASGTGAAASATAGADLFDTTTVHSIAVTYDEDDYQAMLDAYAATGDKEWIRATVVIDGQELQDVGLRLKGNSSLRGLASRPGTDDAGAGATDDADATTDGAGTAEAPADAPARDDLGEGSVSADDPAGLPWLIRLDKYVDGQQYAGRTDLVVRGSSTQSSLNEAVALQVLALADVPAEQATYVRLSVNGGDERLRLVLDLPDDDLWNADTFENPGITYKADSEGDWSYRGEDASAYADAFEVKSSTSSLPEDEQYAPLIELLALVNDASDEEFAAQLGDHLDVDAFARYLAAQDVVQNWDDIDGPGNNSYLRWDETTGLFTVVAWDQNLSFSGGMGGGMGGGTGGGMPGGEPGADGGERPTPPQGALPDLPDGELPQGWPPQGAAPQDGERPAPPDGEDAANGAPGMPGGGPGGAGNALVTRFLATDTFAAAYDEALADLTASAVTNGAAQDHLDALVALLTDQAADLVDPATVTQEAATISQALAAGPTTRGTTGGPTDGGPAGAGAPSTDAPSTGTTST
ncbi:CotH kinase family protein [Cellulomonas iranensis]|uniref:Spore coat protein CotH n=1 Tax=Cellulomonas iranensis TaxID=76862 RepID=A0ABU0GK79_9CELL|nr:CotH kinase family protein [Cellulomonas iranensis]MDQ0425728.1 spore coat protein CotH [Cellulomonas iranensis]